MSQRIKTHPILDPKKGDIVKFKFNNIEYYGYKGEMISSALISNGITIFGKHHKDSASQGIFCANGQCSRCTIIHDNRAIKSCITPLQNGMELFELDGSIDITLAKLNNNSSDDINNSTEIENIFTDVLIIGGGPSGLKAAIELGKLGINTILIDDRDVLGGKLVLQTHNFFGSIEDCYAGTRGFDIAKKLENELVTYNSVNIMRETTAVAVFSDKKIGILYKNSVYKLINPKIVLIATGARERTIAFPGGDLPGVFGAGAFQTLLNRDLIAPSKRVFIIGGGNVGLIAAYHALQGGMNVVGLCEAQNSVGGYKVHLDKIKRLGVPIYLNHTVLSANGEKNLQSITIAQLDSNWDIVSNTEKTFLCDTILVAVGLEKIDQFAIEAERFGIPVFTAGDAQEVSEASAAMFSGKIAALQIAQKLGFDIEIPESLKITSDILKTHPGDIIKREQYSVFSKNIDLEENNISEHKTKKVVYPIFHCFQEIPCNPCVSVCPNNLIELDGKKGNILDLPIFKGNNCISCGKCVAICPGLAITLVEDSALNTKKVSIPFEFEPKFSIGDTIDLNDSEGDIIGSGIVKKIKNIKAFDHRLIIEVEVNSNIAERVVSTPIQDIEEMKKTVPNPENIYQSDETIICHCERVTAGEIRALIKQGIKDFNALKTIRVGMGACGGKTCSSLVERLFLQEGFKREMIKKGTKRPLIVEIPLGAFVNF
ncbi:FAD-dependent oxidoreductase [bacterium]|nr:FAD-dependent oxidoreductase [bacterium]